MSLCYYFFMYQFKAGGTTTSPDKRLISEMMHINRQTKGLQQPNLPNLQHDIVALNHSDSQ